MYVVSTINGTCKAVVYLGHEAGTLAATPLVADRLLIVPLNDGFQSSTLQVYAIPATNSSAWKVVQRVSLQGRIDAPPVLAGTQLAVATDRGELSLFDVTPIEPGGPLRLAARRPAAGPAGAACFPLLSVAGLYAAKAQLTRFEAGSGGKLDQQEQALPGSVFVAPP